MDRIYFKNGFTLVEMLVSLAVFSLMIFILVGTFLNSQSYQTQSAALTVGADNVRLAVERIAREIRGGSNFFVSANNTQLTFTSILGPITTYSTGGCLTNPSHGCIKKTIFNGISTSTQDITSDSINIKTLNFIMPSAPCNSGQQRITIYVLAELYYNFQNSTLPLQTTITPRALNSCG